MTRKIPTDGIAARAATPNKAKTTTKAAAAKKSAKPAKSASPRRRISSRQIDALTWWAGNPTATPDEVADAMGIDARWSQQRGGLLLALVRLGVVKVSLDGRKTTALLGETEPTS